MVATLSLLEKIYITSCFFAYAEENIEGIQKSITNLDTSVKSMMESLESMKPAYAHALQMLEKSSGASGGTEQKVVTNCQNTFLCLFA